ncbi:hypothetical protein PENTCL1PPCAC_21322, partial [Pristionchus entomophagus]
THYYKMHLSLVCLLALPCLAHGWSAILFTNAYHSGRNWRMSGENCQNVPDFMKNHDGGVSSIHTEGRQLQWCSSTDGSWNAFPRQYRQIWIQ